MNRRGMVLVMALVMTALAAMAASSLLYAMRTETARSIEARRGNQAHSAAMAGLQYAITVLDACASSPEAWVDNPALLANQLVTDDGINRWYFSIFSPADDSNSEINVRFGATDLAGLINLNTASADMLAALPNMTTEQVECLRDYIDSDDEPGPLGAEQDAYDQLPLPYLIPNGPLTTLEELLMIKGFHAGVLYGEDLNRNGRLDFNEDDGDEAFPHDNGDGTLARGLAHMVTVGSYEFDVDIDGNKRFDLNGSLDGLGLLDLPGQTREFIRYYRNEDNLFEHPAQLLDMKYKLLHQKGGFAEFPPIAAGTEVPSGIGPGELAKVMDLLTVGPGGKIVPGLININTASLKVLSAVPGLSPELAGRIVDIRTGLDAQEKATIAWLVTEGLVDSSTFAAIAPFLTARSYQFLIRSIGFGLPSGEFRVLECEIDLAGEFPRVTYLRDITPLGRPFALNVETEEF